MKKSRYSLFIFTAPLFLFAIWFFFVCIKYKVVACGVIILFSMIMINALVALIELRQDKLSEENYFDYTGEILKEIRCSLLHNGEPLEIDDDEGVLIIYEKGLDYLYEDGYAIGFIPYENLDDVEVFEDKINISVSGSKEKHYSICSDKPLRIQNICNFLRKEKILDDGKEE